MENVNTFFKELQEINYGWTDSTHIEHYNIAKDKFIVEYRLQTPDELTSSKLGICWDQVEYERCFFNKKKIRNQTFFIINDDKLKYPNHTFLVFEMNNKYYWIENTYTKKGIFEFNSLNECLEIVKNNFIIENNVNPDNSNISIFEYEKPPFHLSCLEFISYCQKGKKI